MTRRYINLGILHSTTGLVTTEPEAGPQVTPVQIAHVLRVEDTFMGNDEFRNLMGMLTVDEIVNGRPNLAIYRHRLT